MAATNLETTKDGKRYYRIRVHGRGGKWHSRRWYVPDGWSARAIERELATVVADFERQVNAREVLNRAEQKAADNAKRQEEEKILTLRQYAEKVFMPTKSITMSENSRCSYQRHFDRDIFPVLGDCKLPTITSRQITALLSAYQKDGKAVASCVKLYTVLQGLFKMALLDDTIAVNPMAKVQRPKPRKDEEISTEPECFTVEEVRHIISCLSNEPLKWQCYVRFLIDTGCRRGECGGLQWRDIDFKTGLVTIRREASYTPQKGAYIDTTKNHKVRSFKVSGDVLELLKLLRREQMSAAISEWVFTQDGSADMMHPQSPTRFFQKFGKRNGIEHFHPHKLRHSFASIALTSGADVVSVSEKLGHSDTAVTLRVYAHATEESIDKASEIFRAAIGK